MYKLLSNYPYTRAFPTRAFTSAVQFSAAEIERMTAFFSKEKLRPADVEQEKSIDQRIRIANVKFYYPDEENFWIFEKLNDIIVMGNEHVWNFDLNGYESFQYTEYEASQGGKYEFHADLDYSDRREMSDPQTRKLSLTLVLNEPAADFEGGEFQFLLGTKPITCAQTKGAVILFPSWVLHRVTPVTKGVRKSLVVWVTGPKFR